MAINNILILGYGKMGQWFAQQLANEYHLAVFEKNLINNDVSSNIHFIKHSKDIYFHKPDLIINAVNLNSTISAFNSILEYLPEYSILSDITSVKNGIKEYYGNKYLRFVSTHPMFGPTFGNMGNLKNENAIIIEESDEEGKKFFERLYHDNEITIHFTPFAHHDELMGESLSLPFLTTLLFAINANRTNTPGTTYQKQLDIAEKLLSEDIHLLTEVLRNPDSLKKIENIKNSLNKLYEAINGRDNKELKSIIEKLRKK
ncbi:MAG: prephenate dehydrogenase/arogenate dehydrogenase family protein [Bacteroidota bacterium]